MVELVDTRDLKSSKATSCGFKSRPGHQVKVLITGGLGYIGSHVVKQAQDNGYAVTVLDDFSTGNEWSVKDCLIIEADITNKNELFKKLKDQNFDYVIHLAAKSIVSESIIKPYYYYINNVVGTLNLVEFMIHKNIDKLVFSSSAAIFGNPINSKINENHPTNPINPYGRSKLIVENMLEDISKKENLNCVSLRYFNVAGADSSSNIGELHEPETHLIPNIIDSINDNTSSFKLFGNDYDTSDGTCIRDYIHVSDVASANLAASKWLHHNKGFHKFNLGNEEGFSVKQILDKVEEITKKNIVYKVFPRRNGDPSVLVSDSIAARKELSWKTSHSSLDNIIQTAYNWSNNKKNII